MTELLATALLWLGAVFTLVAAVGLVRLSDPLVRMHAAAKTGTVGLTMTLLALVLCFGDPGVKIQAALVGIFYFITAPIAAQALGMAVYEKYVKQGLILHCDELGDSKRGVENCTDQSMEPADEKEG